VGELSWQLTDVLCAAGWSADEARNADVHELAPGWDPMSVRDEQDARVLAANQIHSESDTG
jgi:hypothetical protein